MASLYRFKIDLSDVDRGVYESLDFRVAMHPSETEDYLLTRVIAYALNSTAGLEFAPGLCVDDVPAISAPELWIEIGNPAARRVHKALKAARRVRIYTYKNPRNLVDELQREKIHRASELEIFALDAPFLSELAQELERDNRWSLVHQGGDLILSLGELTLTTTLSQYRLGLN